MSNQDKKQWLKQYVQIDARINRLVEKRDALWARITSGTSILTGMPNGGSMDDRMARDIAQLVELEDQINKETDAFIDKRKAIEQAIESVEDMTLQNLLIYRYIDGMSWERIALKMGYTERNLSYLQDKALRAATFPFISE